jgi:hypothetical protein
MMGLRLRARTGLTLAIVVAIGWPAVGARSAQAWSNGEDGYNSYGTHDWVLDHALGALGHRAGWVCDRAALLATDDPDSRDGFDHASGTWWHVYDVWGDTYGGAPEAVEIWVRRTRARLEDGRECAASRALGIAAHLLADVAQPMHTDGRLAAEDRVHGPYEAALDSRSEPGDDVYLFDFDGIDATGAYRRAVRVARQAHRLYFDLVRTYDAHGYNAHIARITQRQLNRAANAIADLIASIA